jgi:hypothetical protein
LEIRLSLLKTALSSMTVPIRDLKTNSRRRHARPATKKAALNWESAQLALTNFAKITASPWEKPTIQPRSRNAGYTA